MILSVSRCVPVQNFLNQQLQERVNDLKNQREKHQARMSVLESQAEETASEVF